MKSLKYLALSALAGLTLLFSQSCNPKVKKSACTPSMKEWYLPNGISTYRNTTPETRVYDVTGFAQEWIHVLNVSEKDATVRLTFYTESLPPSDTVFIVPAGKHTPLYLSEDNLFGLVDINTLYALKATSDENIIIQVTRHESETNTRDNPPSNQLQSNIGYPGPLGDRERRWIYIDCWSLTSDPVWIEKEWLNILNPGKESAVAKITFINRATGEKTWMTRTIEPERIATINFVSLPPDIYKEKVGYSVLVETSVPVVTMQIRRFFHFGNQSPRGMIGIMAFPVGDQLIFKKHN